MSELILVLWGVLFELPGHSFRSNCHDLYRAFRVGTAAYLGFHPLPPAWPRYVPEPDFLGGADAWLREVVKWRSQGLRDDWVRQEPVLRGIAASIEAQLRADEPGLTVHALEIRLLDLIERDLFPQVAVAWARLRYDVEGFSELGVDYVVTTFSLARGLLENRTAPGCICLYKAFRAGVATYLGTHPLPTGWPPYVPQPDAAGGAEAWLAKFIGQQWQKRHWPEQEPVLRGITAEVAVCLRADEPDLTELDLETRLDGLANQNLIPREAVAWARLVAAAWNATWLDWDVADTTMTLARALVKNEFPGTGDPLGEESLQTWMTKGWRLESRSDLAQRRFQAGLRYFLGWVVYRKTRRRQERNLFSEIQSGGLMAGLLVRHLNSPNHRAGIAMLKTLCGRSREGLEGRVSLLAGGPSRTNQIGPSWCRDLIWEATRKSVDLASDVLFLKRRLWLERPTNGAAPFVRLDRHRDLVRKCGPKGDEHYLPSELVAQPAKCPLDPDHRVSRTASTVYVAYKDASRGEAPDSSAAALGVYPAVAEIIEFTASEPPWVLPALGHLIGLALNEQWMTDDYVKLDALLGRMAHAVDKRHKGNWLEAAMPEGVVTRLVDQFGLHQYLLTVGAHFKVDPDPQRFVQEFSLVVSRYVRAQGASGVRGDGGGKSDEGGVT